MFAVIDTFNNNAIISRHRSVRAAMLAERAVARGVRKANGASAYLPTTIVHATKADMSDAREVLVECDWEGDYDSHELGNAIEVNA